MKDLELIIFDLDGTIINSLEDIITAAKYALKVAGCPEPTDEFVQSCIGGGAKNLIKKVLGENKQDLFEDTLANFSKYYHNNIVVDTYVYEGVEDVLEYFYKKKKMAIATFKTKQGTETILEHFNIRQYFDDIVTVNDVELEKPNPECINKILKELKVKQQNAILVGDTITDIQTGKNAGVATCAVSYGFGARKEISEMNPNFLINHMLELKAICPLV